MSHVFRFEDAMDDRQIVLGFHWVAALGNGKVFIPGLPRLAYPLHRISDHRPRSIGRVIDEPGYNG